MGPQRIVIGVDEVGRGALAGPLVVFAVAFPMDAPRVATMYRGLREDKHLEADDSKVFKLAAHREALDAAIRSAALGVSLVERSAAEIDSRLMGVVFPEAVKTVVARLVEQLLTKGIGASAQDYLILLDGDLLVPVGIPCEVRAVPHGDKLIWQIGAASICAKVHRDQRMQVMHVQYPGWGFDQHKGYPTAAHKKVLKKRGPLYIHRRTFKPVAEVRGLPPGFE